MQLVDILGNFIPDRIDAIMGSDGRQGTAQFNPYMAPFPIIVRAPPSSLLPLGRAGTNHLECCVLVPAADYGSCSGDAFRSRLGLTALH